MNKDYCLNDMLNSHQITLSEIGFQEIYEKLITDIDNDWNGFIQEANKGDVLHQALLAKRCLDLDNENLSITYMMMVHNHGDCYFDYDIAVFYLNGRGGLSKDEKKAFDLFLKLAKLEDLLSMREVGKCYEDGIGTPIDMNQAIYWYKRANNKGDEWAGLVIGVRYAQGYHGLKKNNKTAKKWFKQAKKSSIQEVVDIASEWLQNL